MAFITNLLGKKDAMDSKGKEDNMNSNNAKVPESNGRDEPEVTKETGEFPRLSNVNISYQT